MLTGDEIKKENDVKKEPLDIAELVCNICCLKFLDSVLFVQHMSMHDYQENEDEEEFEEEQEPEESNYDDDNGLLDVPPEPAPASTRIVLQPDSIEAIIGSGFKAVLDKLEAIEERLVKIESKVNKLEKDREDLQEYLHFQDPSPPPPKKGRPESFPTSLRAATDIDFTINDSQLETLENKQFLEEHFIKNIPRTFDYKNFLRSGLGLLMTPEAQQSFSWSGRSDNIKIKDFNSMKILNKLCQKELGTPYDVIEAYWRKYFSNVKNPNRARTRSNLGGNEEDQDKMVGHMIDY